MDIAEELKQAHIEYLQDEWDKWLVRGWRINNVMTGYSMKAFMKKFNVDYDTLYSLKRTPRTRTQQHTRLSRYVAAYLPLLNTMLWGDVLTDEQIVAAIKNIDTMMNPSDNHKCRKESQERNKAKKEMYAEIVSHGLVRDQRKLTAKSNWGHCK